MTCHKTGQPTTACKCMDCTLHRIVDAMHDNGLDAGLAEYEARKPEMESELLDAWIAEHFDARDGRGDAGSDGV